MENKPKKSKALIITIIAIILLLIAGYFLVKNRDMFGVKTSQSIAKIFAPLLPSTNTGDSKKITLAQAGEDIKSGDGVAVSGTDADGNPIVMKSDNKNYGVANQDIGYGEIGEISLNTGGSNNFLDSFSSFLNNIFNNGGGVTPPPTQVCSNNAINPPACDDFGSGNNFPTVAVRASPSSVELGGSSTISWTSTNTTSCDTGDGNESSTNGSFNTGALLESKSYTVVCTGENGMTGGNVFVNVSGGLNIFPTVTVTSSPSSVASGASSTISWTSTNTTSCDAGIGNGTGTAGSFETEALTFSKSYTVTCTGDIGSSTGNVFVSVNGIIAPKPECSDEIDNDTDTLIDTLDQNCHLDGDILKDYVPTHDSESSSPESGFPDLKAGAVTPAKALINTITTLSSTIRNEGEGSTISEFSSFFTITKTPPVIDNTETQDDTTNTSAFKYRLKKILSKISWISVASALVNPGTNVINSSQFVATIPVLLPKTSSVAQIQYNFTSAGTYYIRACADKKNISDFGLITESNELNNCGAWTTFTVTDALPPPNELPKCSDGLDNDVDTFIDDKDPNCHLDGDLTKEYISEHYSESSSPETLYQCNDLKDNDYDGKIDDDDSNCHIDGDYTKNYIPTHFSESSSPITEVVMEENKCLLIEQNPLVFSDVEKAKLAELLRKFYLLAPTLKIDTDINMIYSELENYKTLMTRYDQLTKECYLQTNDIAGYTEFYGSNPNLQLDSPVNANFNTAYTGPTTKFGNPWFKYKVRGSYFTDGATPSHSEPIVSSSCTGTVTKGNNDGESCTQFKTKIYCETDEPFGHSYMTGCHWDPQTNLKDYETLLNIW